MRIATHITIDWMETNIITEVNGFDYDGPIAECKGSASKTQLGLVNQQSSAQNQQMQSLMNQFQSAMAPIQQQNNALLGNGGLTPQQQQQFTAQALNQASQGYGNAIGSVNQALVARGMSGGQNAGGGGVAQGFGNLQGQLNQNLQGALSGIDQMKLQSFQNAMNMGAGIAGNYGQLGQGFMQGSNQLLGTGVQAANNVDQAQTSFLGPLLGAAAGVGTSFIPGGQFAKGIGYGK